MRSCLIPVGADPGAVARIAARCGHLPLTLGLIAARLRAQPGWTLTDHADRLDERHHYQHALTLYADLDIPDTGQIRAHLDAIPTGSHTTIVDTVVTPTSDDR